MINVVLYFAVILHGAISNLTLLLHLLCVQNKLTMNLANLHGLDEFRNVGLKCGFLGYNFKVVDIHQNNIKMGSGTPPTSGKILSD